MVTVGSIGYYVITVGRLGNKDVIQHYIASQGRKNKYAQLHNDQLGSLINTPMALPRGHSSIVHLSTFMTKGAVITFPSRWSCTHIL